MVTIQNLERPESFREALSYKAQHREAPFLAGGTYLLARPDSTCIENAIDISRLLPHTFKDTGSGYLIGAGLTFQEFLEQPNLPPVFVKALMTMSNRNIRNRATVGGNIGANKSCASLIPLFLLLNAEVELAESSTLMPLADWLESPKGIITTVHCQKPAERFMNFCYLRRTSCDLSMITAAVAYTKSGTALKNVQIVLGGFSLHAQVREDLAGLFEGKALPDSKEAVISLVRAQLKAISDQRGSSDYKEFIGAERIAQALVGAEAQP